jgi:hypothetical protein
MQGGQEGEKRLLLPRQVQLAQAPPVLLIWGPQLVGGLDEGPHVTCRLAPLGRLRQPGLVIRGLHE